MYRCHACHTYLCRNLRKKNMERPKAVVVVRISQIKTQEGNVGGRSIWQESSGTTTYIRSGNEL
jgi:hypothetical protein